MVETGDDRTTEPKKKVLREWDRRTSSLMADRVGVSRRIQQRLPLEVHYAEEHQQYDYRKGYTDQP